MSTPTTEKTGWTWEEICADPHLQDLPYKVETNRYGHVVLSPHKRYHSRIQARISDELRDHLEEGVRFVELAIQTSEGTKVADVAWMSTERDASIPEEVEPTPVAPQICVEVRSPTNTDAEIDEKRQLYLDAGAEEVWILDEDGRITFYDADGEIERSHRVPSFPSQVEI